MAGVPQVIDCSVPVAADALSAVADLRGNVIDIRFAGPTGLDRLGFDSSSYRVGNVVHSSRTFHLTVALSIGLLFYAVFLLIPHSPLLNDPDTFWHIATGQWILDHAQFPTFDVFSYTAAGSRWISTEWLSEVLYAVAFKLGDWRAVVDLAAITCGAIIGSLCFYLLRNLRFSVAIAWTAISAAPISSHFLARPHIFSYLLLVIWTIKLLDAYDRDDFKASSLFFFVPVMVLWANLHGSFTFGLALLYVFSGVCFIQRWLRRDYAKCWPILAVVAAVTLAALLTPYGIYSALATRELLNLKYTIPQIIELHSPDFQNDHVALVVFAATVLTIAGLGVRLRGARLIVFGLLIFVGLTYTRGLVMFFLLAPCILARPLSRRARFLAPQLSASPTDSTGRSSDPVLLFLHRRAVAVATTCAAIAVLVSASTWWLQNVAPPPSTAPQAALDFVRGKQIAGNVFNDYDFGGFLLFSGIPTFVDGRALPFGDEFLHRYFDAADLVDIGDAFKLLDDYKVNWIILKPAEPLVKAIARSPGWDRVYADQYAVVFVRRPS